MTDLGHNRGWLSPAPAASIARIDRQIGHPLQVTEAGRTWAQQKAHWDTYQRYGKPIALHPDTPSLHQLGNAIDSDEAQRFVGLMADHGWIRTVWRNGRLVEPWHFEYRIADDRHRNDPAPTPVQRPTEVDPMTMLPTRIDGTHKCVLGPGSFRHMIESDDPDHVMRVLSGEDRWNEITLAELPEWLRHFGCDLHIWNVVAGKFVVLDPLTGVAASGNVWTATGQARAESRAGFVAVEIANAETTAYLQKLADA